MSVVGTDIDDVLHAVTLPSLSTSLALSPFWISFAGCGLRRHGQTELYNRLDCKKIHVLLLLIPAQRTLHFFDIFEGFLNVGWACCDAVM